MSILSLLCNLQLIPKMVRSYLKWDSLAGQTRGVGTVEDRTE